MVKIPPNKVVSHSQEMPKIPSTPKNRGIEEVGSQPLRASSVKDWVQGKSVNIIERHVQKKQNQSLDQVILTSETVKDLKVPPAVILKMKQGESTVHGSGFPIHENFVVTARHCIYNKTIDSGVIRDSAVILPQNLWSEGEKSQMREPIRYHLFAADGSVISIDLRDENGKLKSPLMDDRLISKKTQGNGLIGNIKNKVTDKIINIPDIALIEFEEPFKFNDGVIIPPLLDEKSIDLLLENPVPKRLMGFSLERLKKDIPDKNERHAMVKTTPLQISCRPSHQLYLKNHYHQEYTQSKGLQAYGGDSGGPVMVSVNGKNYFIGSIVGGNKGLDRNVIVPLNGDIMKKLIRPTLDNYNKEHGRDSLALENIEWNEAEFNTHQSFLEAIKNWLYDLLPSVAQDFLFNWSLEDAIQSKNFESFFKCVSEYIDITQDELLNIKFNDITVGAYFGLATKDDFDISDIE